jgi:predicted DCC family thiol-disulfide oxidoreductase YuxK
VQLRARPVLVYDGECGFCTRAVRWALRLPAEMDVIAWQEADLPTLGLSRVAAAGTVQWVDIDNGAQSGHRAVAALLRASGRPWSWLGRAMLLPGASWLGAQVYRLVSANRHRLPGGTPACALPPERRPGARDQPTAGS